MLSIKGSQMNSNQIKFISLVLKFAVVNEQNDLWDENEKQTKKSLHNHPFLPMVVTLLGYMLKVHISNGRNTTDGNVMMLYGLMILLLYLVVCFLMYH